MTLEKLRYAKTLMADRTRAIADISRELVGVPANTVYHYLYADGRLREPRRRLLEP